MLVQKNIIGAPGRQITIGAIGLLCWYIRSILVVVLISRVLKEHSGDCVGTEEYYKSTGEAVFLKKRVLQEHWRGCADTAE